jgi:hypothetical protein
MHRGRGGGGRRRKRKRVKRLVHREWIGIRKRRLEEDMIVKGGGEWGK